MKELIELFIYKPKKTERIIITCLKLLFALCYTTWAYSLIGVENITDQVVTLEKLKPFILNGHVILFLFVFYLLYQLFFNYSSWVFSLIGKISYLIARIVYYIVFSLIIDFIFSLIAWPFTKQFRFELRRKPNIEDGFFAFSYKFFKKLMHKGKLLKSKEQRVRSSKQLADTMKKMKEVMIEGSEEVFKHIHTVFMFSLLFCVFYFFYIREVASINAVMDKIVLWTCIVIGSFQILLYWLYRNFRLLYYFYLLLYRGFHKQDVLDKELNQYMEQLALEIQRQVEESINTPDQGNEGTETK